MHVILPEKREHPITSEYNELKCLNSLLTFIVILYIIVIYYNIIKDANYIMGYPKTRREKLRQEMMQRYQDCRPATDGRERYSSDLLKRHCARAGGQPASALPLLSPAGMTWSPR